MVKRNSRRPSSASPTPRPRRIAGRVESTPVPPQALETPEQDAEGREPAEWAPVGRSLPGLEDEPGSAPLGPGPESPSEAGPAPEPDWPEPDWAEPDGAGSPPDAGFVGSPRTTRILLVAIVVLAVVAMAGGIFLWVRDDEPATATEPAPMGAPADDETPVVISGEDARVAVAAAADAASTIVATSYQDYDAQVEEAAELMTPAFAEEYRQTAGDVAEAIVSSKTEVQVEVVAQGVVRADQEQAQALVFLNQLVNKDGKDPEYTAYRVLVTVVNTDQGWLVSDLETK